MNIAIRIICGAYLALSAVTVIFALASYFNIDIWPFGRKEKNEHQRKA